MDLRDLQRTGRIGRIDVQIESKKGETRGEILISSSLDRAETAVLASALETIDRVGPCIAHITVDRIEDIRVTKKRKIIERAKELLLDRFEDTPIDTIELLDQVRDTIRIGKLLDLGEERLPAGPHVADTDAIIVVEGRADVINLLKYSIKNAIAVEGTKVPKTIIDLCETKIATAFLDGDRGGELILRELLQVADIDFVAFAPRGRSVEEMSRKEITKALRNKVPVEFIHEQYRQGKEREMKDRYISDSPSSIVATQKIPIESSPKNGVKLDENHPMNRLHTIDEHIKEVSGRMIARLLASDLEIIGEYRADEIEKVLDMVNGDLSGVIIDRIVDQKLLDDFSWHGIELVVARDFKGIIKRPITVKLVKIP